ncbi:MAG: VWA domain-containing protein [Candidatus Acidiferrales bacterium]
MPAARTFARSFALDPLLSIALTAVLCGAALAPAPAGPQTPVKGTPQQPPPPQPQREDPQIRVRVDLVTTPVTVRNSSGQMVFDLASSEFRVFDNRVEQKIEQFEMGGLPLSVVVVLETSSRVEPLLDAVRRTGIIFTQKVMGEFGEAAVLGVEDRVEVLQDFTDDDDAVENAIARIQMGTGGLRLYDAMGRAVEMLTTRSPERRRVMIVVSEAADTGSEVPLGEVLRQAQIANVSIYTAGLSKFAADLKGEPKSGAPPSATPPGIMGRPGPPGSVQTPDTQRLQRGNINLLALVKTLVEKGTNLVADNSLEVAATATGGTHQGSFGDASIERAISEIGGELHSQYVVSYRPAGVQAGGYHEIEVRVRRPNLHVRARPGYYLPANSAGKN